jgi:hypothetical protein
MSSEEEAFLDSLENKLFQYFWVESNPANGLVKDRSTPASPASMAATGFGVAAWAVGAERRWISREQAARRTLLLLRFLCSSEQSVGSSATGYKGFYYHFVDMESGRRFWNCELSTVDTAWLLAGIRFARQYYDRSDPVEKEIRERADFLTRRVDWDWATVTQTDDSGTVALCWNPETGLSPYGWMGYNESMYLYILAAGSGYPNAEKAFRKWHTTYSWEEPYPGLNHFIFLPLFGHFLSHVWVDFRNLADELLDRHGIDYFENSRRAVLTQRRYAVENPMKWVGYDSLTWGLSPCDGPGPSFDTKKHRFFSYEARGTSGPRRIHNDDGTIAPYAAGSSIVFAPEAVIPTLQSMAGRFGSKGLCGKYGFVDAFNLTAGWYDPDCLGIDQGPFLLMIENFRTGLIWEYTMKDPVVKKGLERLGFRRREPGSFKK